MPRKRRTGALPGQLLLPHLDPADLLLADLAGDIQNESGYVGVRALCDGTIVALGRLTFTTAVYVDLSRTGWARRYCFASAPLAVAAFNQLRSADDEPTDWVTRRHG